jgi:hypothetical protein
MPNPHHGTMKIDITKLTPTTAPDLTSFYTEISPLLCGYSRELLHLRTSGACQSR